LAIVCFIAGGLVYFLEPAKLASKYFLGGGSAMLAIWPYTIFAIMPINYQLMDGDGRALWPVLIKPPGVKLAHVVSSWLGYAFSLTKYLALRTGFRPTLFIFT
jgi:hypothetical protein